LLIGKASAASRAHKGAVSEKYRIALFRDAYCPMLL